jgi:hypothetical protein
MARVTHAEFPWMKYADTVAATWRHSAPESPNRAGRQLVRYATLAASSHNTQPWLFEFGRDCITIHPDFGRRCPAVDPDDHHLFASLGCAAKNLALAARATGLEAYADYDPGTRSLRISLAEKTAGRSPLFDAIVRRQCTRTAYDGSRLSLEDPRLLEAASRGREVEVLLLTADRAKV